MNMRRMKWPIAWCFMSALFLSNPTLAEEQTVELELQNLTCASCYYIVNKALLGVDGVLKVEFPDAGIAEVVYEDTLCEIEDMTEATAQYGFPSTVLEEEEATTQKRRPRIQDRRSIGELLKQLIQG